MMRDYYYDEFGRSHSFFEGMDKPKPLSSKEVKEAVKAGILEAFGCKEVKPIECDDLDSDVDYFLSIGLTPEQIKKVLIRFNII